LTYNTGEPTVIGIAPGVFAAHRTATKPVVPSIVADSGSPLAVAPPPAAVIYESSLQPIKQQNLPQQQSSSATQEKKAIDPSSPSVSEKKDHPFSEIALDEQVIGDLTDLCPLSSSALRISAQGVSIAERVYRPGQSMMVGTSASESIAAAEVSPLEMKPKESSSSLSSRFGERRLNVVFDSQFRMPPPELPIRWEKPKEKKDAHRKGTAGKGKK
jgi:hypothetical protein